MLRLTGAVSQLLHFQSLSNAASTKPDPHVWQECNVCFQSERVQEMEAFISVLCAPSLVPTPVQTKTTVLDKLGQQLSLNR
eukprot:2505162-Amphidinium_carterae.1